MPTISVKKIILDQRLGVSYTKTQFDELCFDYGLELDEVTTDKGLSEKEIAALEANGKDMAAEIVYKIDIPANRYDLLCVEGLSRALLVFQKKKTVPVYRAVDPPKGERLKLIVESSTEGVRPYCVAAVLRDLTFTQVSYNSFIELQDKLHQNLCRKRTLVAIGTHDLDVIEAPFVYKALPPGDIMFVPLNQTKSFTALELMELYSTDSHLRHYLHILQGRPLYPVIYDHRGRVLSMPPIINGDHSKITLGTRNVFIECTATDLTKANVVLNTMVTMFSEYCQQPFTIEKVDVVYGSNGEDVRTYPSLEYRVKNVSVESLNKQVGINVHSTEICSLLDRMSLSAEVTSTPDKITVKIPPTRADILHVADLVEDAAIAYGYNNIKELIPQAYTVASEVPLNKLTDLLRLELAMAGFTEALTFSLCSRDDIGTSLRNPSGTNVAVCISNPKTLEFQVGRTTLLPGLLKTISYNRNMPLPLKLFEIQDVLLKDPAKDVGARNERRLCAVYYGKTPGLEVIHGLLDRVMQNLGVKSKTESTTDGYYLTPKEDPSYFVGRCASIHGPANHVIGTLGIVHPDVASAFDLKLLCSAVEISIEQFV